MSKFKTTIAFVCPALTVFMCFAITQQKAAIQAPPEDESVKRVLRTKAEDKETRYIVVLRDLNGDGIPEAIAYMVGNDWCGSGGCNLFILQKSGDSWKIVSNVTITYPPVRIFNDSSNGWHNLGVQGGGGVLEPMTLDFDSMAQRTEKIYLFLRFIGQAKIPVGK
jgi:hypothetical protein